MQIVKPRFVKQNSRLFLQNFSATEPPALPPSPDYFNRHCQTTPSPRTQNLLMSFTVQPSPPPLTAGTPVISPTRPSCPRPDQIHTCRILLDLQLLPPRLLILLRLQNILLRPHQTPKDTLRCLLTITCTVQRVGHGRGVYCWRRSLSPTFVAFTAALKTRSSAA